MKRDKQKVDVDVSFNSFYGSGSKGIIPSTNDMTSYIKNSYIKIRKGESIFSLYQNDEGSFLIPTIDNYAIIPKEEYDVYLKWNKRRKNSSVKVLNLGGN